MAAEKKERAFSAPLPLRAIGDARLAGLDLRVLACVAAHDRMSLKLGSGQGCWASHESMAAKIGCNYINLGKSLKKLLGLGYITCERQPGDQRAHIYRVRADLYDHEESLSFHQPSADARERVSSREVGQTANDGPEMVGQGVEENPIDSTGSPSQYISLSDERYLSEDTNNTPLERAHPSGRSGFGGSGQQVNDGAGSEAEGLGEGENGKTVGANLARLERALKSGNTTNLDWLAWAEFLEGVAGDTEAGNNESGWAVRLSEQLLDAMPDDDYGRWEAGHGPQPDPAAEEAEKRRHDIATRWHKLPIPQRREAALSVGMTPAQVRDFMDGKVTLQPDEQGILSAALKRAALPQQEAA